MPAFRASLGVTVQATQIAGVPVFRITPRAIPERNRRRLLMHLHGGGYVLYPGEVGAGEGMLMAGLGGFEVVSVDYRMPPDRPFPAALDDATAVWRALLAENDASRMAIFGISAGGGLTLATVLHARDQGIALPAAIAPGTPWVDLAGDGDSRNANAFVDNILVADTGWLGGAARLYAGGHDLRDPLISPIHGDFHGLPPAIITTGTRDLFLSDSVRTHRKLRQAGIDAALQVFEGMSHGQFVVPGVPETTGGVPRDRGLLRPASGGLTQPSAAQSREEAAQQRRRLAFPHAADHLRPVVAGRGLEHPRAMFHPAALGIVGTEHEAADAEQADRLRAHRAGFQRHVQVALGQARFPPRSGGGTQRQQLRMRGRIRQLLHPVARAREDGAVRPGHDRAHRHLPPRGGRTGFLQRRIHGLHRSFRLLRCTMSESAPFGTNTQE